MARRAFERIQVRLERINSHVEIIVSDIGMLGEDDYTLIRKVRALSPEAGGKTPAVALAAYARIEDSIRALAAGY